MLCQLVCVDRRYQRMNCFNIRELQGNLKRKFFADLINISDHRDFLDSTMIGLRFRTNNEFNIYHDTLSFHNLGTTNESKSRSANFTNFYDSSFNMPTMAFLDSSYSFKSTLDGLATYFISTLNLYFSLFINAFSPQSLISLLSLNTLSHLALTLTTNFSFGLTSAYNTNSDATIVLPSSASNAVNFESNDVSTPSDLIYSQLGSSSDFRNNAFTNPIISYDYKCGHYLGL